MKDQQYGGIPRIPRDSTALRNPAGQESRGIFEGLRGILQIQHYCGSRIWGTRGRDVFVGFEKRSGEGGVLLGPKRRSGGGTIGQHCPLPHPHT